MAGDGKPVPTQSDGAVKGTGDKQAGNGSSAETSANLLSGLYKSHVESVKRNTGDSEGDNGWAAADTKSISTAQATQGLATKLDDYIKGGGDFSDQAGQKLAQQFIDQLRVQRDDHIEDRQGAAGYSGKTGLPQEVQDKVTTDAQSISDDVHSLLVGKGGQLQPDVLAKIEASAKSINTSMSKGDQTSKDVRDIKSESDVILADVAALKGAELDSTQRYQLKEDIDSKAGSLIPQELSDINSEGKEIKNDNNAVKIGGDLEAMLGHAVANPGDKATRSHIQDRLHDLSSSLNDVIGDRQFDMVKEPKYAAANAEDSKQIDQPIIEFTNPYKTK